MARLTDDQRRLAQSQFRGSRFWTHRPMMIAIKLLRPFISIGVVAVHIASPLVGQVSAPAPDGSVTIESGRPLSEATKILGDRYGEPVSFEEPKWRWKADLMIGSMIVGNPPTPFFLPGGLNPEQTPTVDSAVLKLLDAYHSQNGNGRRFRVERSRLGLHIVPVQFHDTNGALALATSILDAHVTVAAAVRLASEHIKAVCKAVKASTGVELILGLGGSLAGLDFFFAANGITAPRNAIVLPAKQREKYSFLWGVSEVTAREAVLRLLEQSGTTLSWRMLCDPSVMGDPRFCVLNFSPLRERVRGEDGKLLPGPRSLIFDRAMKRPVPPPPLPPPALEPK